MKKVPSYLKGLAETRARVAADVIRYTRIRDEVITYLAVAEAELAACDRLIKKFDLRLDPTSIKPIKAWQGRYGQRGALKDATEAYLKTNAPTAITTTEICWELQTKFQLDFEHPMERKRWINNSLKTHLRRLVGLGQVERSEETASDGSKHRGWRWKQEGAKTLDDLAAMATAAGVGVQQGEADVEV
jgi:hypothetical protein